MSIHGICFDEGQAGNCGCDCRGFLDGECEIPEEILEHSKDEFFPEYFGELKLAVARQQTKIEFDEDAEYRKLFPVILSDLGYKPTTTEGDSDE